MSFLCTGMVRNYWFETGTPTLLIQKIRECPDSVMEFGELVAEQNSPLNVSDLSRLELTPLMWQTGYLTIREYDEASNCYRLDFPNREVREAFFKTLAPEFAELKAPTVSRIASQCKRHLAQYEFFPFIETMRSLFARIPNTLPCSNKSLKPHTMPFSSLFWKRWA